MEKRIRILLSLFVISISLLCVKIFSISSKNPAKEALSGQYTRRFTAAAKSGGIYDRALMPLSYSDNQYITK
jgi:cell division protein FtsI/penicillin-binding protein 2